ncbi:MAG: hypothetical protein EPO10_19370 [Reyranella sp.]|nr:MAG: hypothetical protein EPO10_19370 [Reyranella sp.]
MKGLIRKGTKFAYQAAIPADVRNGFDGKKKFQKVFQTNDPIYAERLAAEADREFRTRILQLRQQVLDGERVDPKRVQQVVGWLFGQYFGKSQHEFFDLRAHASSMIAEAHEERFPLVRGISTEGVFFDELIDQVETLLEWAEATGWAKRARVERPEATLLGAHSSWAKKAQHTQKTKDQYAKEVRSFTEWFEERRGTCYGAKINKHDVNQFTAFLMSKDVAKATILRALSVLRLIYKVGQFSNDNPFSGVTDRMVIEGSTLKVRRFTDKEILALFQAETDANVALAIKMAAYSGMRLSEITALKIEHIESAGKGGHIFNLMNAGRRKTAASYRKVPLHPTLWRTIRSAIKSRAPSEYILPGEPTDKYGNRSAALSKRIARVIDLVTDDPAAREHSFRHALISKLAEAGVRKEWRMAIVGHEGSDVHDQYTQADYLTQLLGIISKVEYRVS